MKSPEGFREATDQPLDENVRSIGLIVLPEIDPPVLESVIPDAPGGVRDPLLFGFVKLLNPRSTCPQPFGGVFPLAICRVAIVWPAHAVTEARAEPQFTHKTAHRTAAGSGNR
jgi:hypothetical protein